MMGRKKSLVMSVILFVGLFVGVFSQSVGGTGSLGNQPSGGYSEGNEVFALMTGDSVATTSFSPGETFLVRITSYLVDLQGNGQVENTLYLTDYLGNQVSIVVAVFTQQDVNDAHVYSQSIQAPGTPDHYLVVARIEDGNGNKFTAMDVIIVGGGTSPQKYIKTYSDSTYSTVDWAFTSEDIVYIELYSDRSPNPGQSSVKFADYNGGESITKIGDLSDNTVTMSGDYARMQYDLSEDLDVVGLTDWVLNEDYWYTLTVDLRMGGGEVITNDWSIQIQITEVGEVKPSLSVENGATQAVPGTVEREGDHITTISTQFEDTDKPNVNTLTIVFKVRDSNGDEIIIVDRKKNGQSGEFGGTLVVTSSVGGVYTASYELDPDSNFMTGYYDLYFMVEDGTGEAVEDGYQNNLNELRITSSTSPPHVNNDATQCNPNTVDKIGEYVTTISTQFSDSDSIDVTDFTVLFKIRGPEDREIVLVDNKTNGQAGEFGGNLDIISSAQGIYSASYTFDPDGTFKSGYYDLYFKVTDQHGNSDTDEYFWNLWELYITSSTAEPTVEAGATQVIPSVVDKTEDGTTTISAQFEDTDSNSISNFTVTFKVKDEDGNEYVIVDSAKDGESGEHGGTLTITSSSPNVFVASYNWNPPSSMPNGNYSLYFKVEDEYGSYDEDSYDNNPNELMIIGEAKGEQESAPNWTWVLLALMILVLLLILLIALQRRKVKASYMPPKTTEQDTAPPSSYEDISPSSPKQPL